MLQLDFDVFDMQKMTAVEFGYDNIYGTERIMLLYFIFIYFL